MTSSVRQSTVGRLLDGRYRVLSHIADGGMASVYLAVDERLDREVAVKIMRRELVSDETFVSRFRREARSAARLSHPNVVAVFDQGDDGDDMFLAMEYVPGRTLREVLTQEGPLTPRAALDIFDRILQALDAAHSAGLIHRDVKPENVIIREDGVVKVADFGLARAVTAATTNASGTLLGTVAYLSPEQVERGIADARSDVYAAGLVLFEMVTARKAFDGDTPIHVAYQHVHGTVPSASAMVRSVPTEIDRLVALGTARDPDQRPASAGDYLVEVRRARARLSTTELDLRPADPERGLVAATPTTRIPAPTPVRSTSAYRTQAHPTSAHPTSVIDGPRRRRRWPAVLALLAALLLAGGGAGWWFLAGPGAQTRVPTVASLDERAAVAAIEQAGLSASVRQSFDETVPTGLVISSDPGGAATVARRSTVTLTVSKGPERYAAPTLTGTAATAAAATLSGSHLALGTSTDAYSDTVAAGTILTQDPTAGTLLKPGATVAIVVSKGRQPIPVTDFTGKPAADAKNALGAAGLTVVEGPAVNSDTVAQGSVVSQDPKTGTLTKGSTVTLVVSKGPVLVAVPDTVGKQRGEAAKLLRQAGFAVSYNEILGGFFGTVRGSDPSAGTMVRKGATITLTIV